LEESAVVDADHHHVQEACAQQILDDAVDAEYRRLVEGRSTEAEKAAGWSEFGPIRSRLVDEHSMRIYGDAYLRPPNYLTLRFPVYGEDQDALAEVLRNEAAEARTAGAGPAHAAIDDGDISSWHRQDVSIGERQARFYVEWLEQAKWKYVCHVSFVKLLPKIAQYGLRPGLEAAFSSPRDVNRASKSQSNPEVENIVRLHVCSTFWPAWWVSEKRLGRENSVIVVLDAKGVCTRLGTKFFPRAIAGDSFLPDDLLGARNSEAEGAEAFKSCWRNGEPRKTNHEILSNRLHPRLILGLIYPTQATQDEWHPRFCEELVANYPNLSPVPSAVHSIPLKEKTERSLGFPPPPLDER
jgi:hypothetical protein